VLFNTKGWHTVVGFQTRNVPHLGHEYVQKTALTFVDGLFINPVIGRKKAGDFKDAVILAAYEELVQHYYVRERTVMATLHTEMRYAGPREAIFHAIVRKNFGCTHFIVGRDHAGVGDYYAPYAAQEIFDDFPDLGIIPLFFTAFFYCRRCGSVAHEKICPHGVEARLDFSGTLLRQLLTDRHAPDGLIRPEVAEIILGIDNPFVEENLP
jgi:sulfate adenylyltransferase